MIATAFAKTAASARVQTLTALNAILATLQRNVNLNRLIGIQRRESIVRQDLILGFQFDVGRGNAWV
jgi:hypothetical protein